MLSCCRAQTMLRPNAAARFMSGHAEAHQANASILGDRSGMREQHYAPAFSGARNQVARSRSMRISWPHTAEVRAQAIGR